MTTTAAIILLALIVLPAAATIIANEMEWRRNQPKDDNGTNEAR